MTVAAIQRVYLTTHDTTLQDTLNADAAAVNRLATAGFSEAERAELLQLLQRALSNVAPEAPRKSPS